jgi:hypothetical protein
LNRNIGLQVWIKVYLENVAAIGVFAPPFELAENLRIRTTLLAERKELYDSHGFSRGGFSAEVDSLGCVIETSVTTSSMIDSPEISEAENRLQSVFSCLLIYFDRLVKMKGLYGTLGKVPDISKLAPSDFAPYRDPIWRHMVCSLHKLHRLELRFSEFEKLKDFWLRFERLRKPYFLEASIARFAIAANAAGEPEKAFYRFVDYVTSMEALLLEGEGELSQRLALRMATLVGGTADDHQNTYEFMKRAYELRSELVHGRRPDPIRIRRAQKDVQVDFEEALGRLHSYSRQCIRRIVELVEAIPESETEAMSDERKKKWVTDLLDLSVLRSDLRDSLEAFLSGRQESDKLRDDYRNACGAPFYAALLEEENARSRMSHGG